MDKKDLSSLPNIGEVMKQQLMSVGIDTAEKLVEMGSINAYKKLKIHGFDPCYSALYGLEGAVRGIRWHLIDRNELKKLKEQVADIYK